MIEALKGWKFEGNTDGSITVRHETGAVVVNDNDNESEISIASIMLHRLAKQLIGNADDLVSED